MRDVQDILNFVVYASYMYCTEKIKNVFDIIYK